MRLSNEAREELLERAGSAALREDMRALRRLRKERDQGMTAREFVIFATVATALAGHPLKPRRPFPENDMRL